MIVTWILTATISTTISATALAAPTPRPARQVTVVATDYRLALPDTLPSGALTLVVENRGRELHHVSLVRLDEGKTIADLERAFQAGGPPPRWAVNVGGANAVDPGATSLAATVHLVPGHYAAICVIPSADGAPHVMKGMVRPFVVTPAVSQASAAPEVDATVTLFDYGYQASRPLGPSTHRIRVRNTGTQPHELVLVRLAPGKTVADLGAWVERMQGPPPAHFLGGVSMLDPGQENELALDLTPGHYAMLCFIPDAKDGKPHVAHGMARDFEVK